jgi:hypothetical protein
MELDALLRRTLRDLLRELVDGPPGEFAFVLNPGDRGLIGSLAQLSAAEASARPNGRSSVAAHTQHVRYGFELLSRWIGGDDNAFAGADFARSWGTQAVGDAEWQTLRDGLEQETRNWGAALDAPREWDRLTLGAAIGSVAHLAYHIGAIRQLAKPASGPPASD